MPRIGRVVAYDPDIGLGTVRETQRTDDLALSTHSFHCTAIADGSRAIDPGTKVAFVLVAGLGGALEARSVTPINGRVATDGD